MRCCHPGCDKSPDFRIDWGDQANPDNYTEACEDHVGSLLGHHPGTPAPDCYRVSPIEISMSDKKAA